jgi:hypothetical protein
LETSRQINAGNKLAAAKKRSGDPKAHTIKSLAMILPHWQLI